MQKFRAEWTLKSLPPTSSNATCCSDQIFHTKAREPARELIHAIDDYVEKLTTAPLTAMSYFSEGSMVRS